MFSPINLRSKLAALVAGVCFATLVPVFAQTSPKSPARKSAPNQRAMTQADVLKSWRLKDDVLLSNQIRNKGLAFEPEEDWFNQMTASTGVTPADMPKSTTELRSRIPVGPPLETVSAVAPELLDKAKAAAQFRNSKDMEALLHPELLSTKAKVYDLFDVANYRGHTLGKYAPASNRQISVQFFQLTSSQVERVHYIYFSLLRGKVVIRDVKSGQDIAQKFLADEEQLAKSKLELMFRALNDGDDAGVKLLATDGLYQAIKDWGGEKHPGDRLTRGRRLEQVSVKTSVPLDQKSVRVVARISYPLDNGKKIEFDADFERIGNDLKIVRVRDTENKIVLVDPDIDNYLNKRFGLPEGPKLDVNNVAMSEQVVFWSLKQLRAKARRALEDHDPQKIKELAQTFIDSDPGGGEGYGIRAAANQILGNFDEAEKDSIRSIEHGGTAYLVAQRHGAWQNEPFTPVVLGISKTKIEYIPGPGRGLPEDIDIRTTKVKFDTGIAMLKSNRPFLSMSFKGSDGKGKNFNFAALGSSCMQNQDLVAVGGGGVCGTAGGSGKIIIFDPNSKESPLFVPRNWQQSLTTVLRTVQEAQKAFSR